MSSLQTALDEYLAVRRALGHKLLLEGACYVDLSSLRSTRALITSAPNWP